MKRQITLSAYTDNSKIIPEYALLFAIIEKAVADLKSHDRIIRKDAVNWINSSSIKQWSFLWILQSMGVEQIADALRKQAHTLTEKIKTLEENKHIKPRKNKSRGRSIHMFLLDE